MSATFFNTVHEILNAAKAAPSPGRGARQVYEALPDSEVSAAFFQLFDDPAWIEQFSSLGVFDSSHITGSNPWDPPYRDYLARLGYLVRMAKERPEAALEAIHEVRSSDERVFSLLVSIFLAAPSDLAAQYIDTLVANSSHPEVWIATKEVSQLIRRLVSAGDANAGMALFVSFYAPVAEAATENDTRFIVREDLGAAAQALVPSNPGEIIETLTGWLQGRISRKYSGSIKENRDQSHYWRPAIEEHSNNQEYDFDSHLVGILRSACEVAVESEALPLGDVLGLIPTDSYQVFVRLRLHLLAEFGDREPAMTKSEMLETERYDHDVFHHEYARLLRKQWSLLGESERARWFAWIDSNPDTQSYIDGYKRNFDEAPSDEQVERYVNGWRYARLAWIEEHLEGDRREFYKEQLAAVGPPEFSEFSGSWEVGTWTERSPLLPRQFDEMAIPESIEFMRTWTPPTIDTFSGPSREGLAHQLRSRVSKDANSWSRHATEFVGIHQEYIYAFVDGLIQALRDGSTIELDPVVEFMAWCTKQGASGGETQEVPWTGIKGRVCELIEQASHRRIVGFESKAVPGILATLLEQGGSSLLPREPHPDVRLRDYATRAINDVRGKALEALLVWANAYARTQLYPDEKKPLPGGTVDSVPQVRSLIDRALEIRDARFEVHTVLGMRFGQAYVLDPDWARSLVPRAFDLEGGLRDPNEAQGWAAWNGFLVFGPPVHKAYFDALVDQYKFAVANASGVSEEKIPRENPFARLGSHLMLLYGRGDFEGDDQIVWDFLSGTDATVRWSTIDFVGRSLYRGKSPEGMEPVIKRFQRLWERYWESYGPSDCKALDGESPFGYWFASGAFPTQWSLDQMLQSVQVASQTSPASLIIDRLQELAEDDPYSVVQILNEMLEPPEGAWRSRAWRDQSKKILSIALNRGGDAKGVAEQLIDSLGRQGQLDYGALLGYPEFADLTE